MIAAKAAGIGLIFKKGAGYCDEAIALFNRLTGEQPSAALKELINEVIVYAKEDGWFQLGDCWYMRGVHTSELACQNWIKNANNSVLYNSPVFTPKVGIKGDGVAAYIDNNYTPFTDAINFSIDSATIYLMSKDIGNVNTKLLLGATVGTDRQYIYTYASANDRVYLFSEYYSNPLKFYNDEYVAWVRDGLNVQGYKDGVTVGGNDEKTRNGGNVNLSIYELAGNTGSAVNHYNGSLAFTFYGAKLTAEQVAALYTRIKYFYDNVGSTF